MANRTGQRRVAETSKILTNLAAANAAINISNNEAVNKILNERFISNNELQKRRLLRAQTIKQTNQAYIAATENVLDDKTLDFLVKHSQIDAPTLTSIFAGFELARASKAKKLDELRQSNINEIQQKEQADADKAKNEAILSQSRIQQIENDRKLALTQSQTEANALITSNNADIAAQEREDAREDTQSFQERRDKVARDEAERLRLEGLKNFDLINFVNQSRGTGTTDQSTTNEVTDDIATAPPSQTPPVDTTLETSSIQEQEQNPVQRQPTGIQDNSLVLKDAFIEDDILESQPLTGDDINSTIDFTEGTEVVNTPSADDTVLFSPEVVEQLGIINDLSDTQAVDILGFQQDLIDSGLNPADLTAEEINEQFKTYGLKQ